jgi:RNA polymerase sigma-70 factor (ECF subfamily)
MLGSASDAEDIVQEALLRAADAKDLLVPRAYLTTVVTRLCIDELRSARRRRETYVGPWLPEPLLTSELDAPSESGVEHRENVSMAFLLLLDQLSPLERAVFVLREVFELEFSEIGSAIQRSEAACRKLLSRAKTHVEERRDAAVPASSERQLAVAGAFMQALISGDLNQVVKLLADEVSTTTDHGGKASAAQNTLLGPDRVGRFFLGLFGKSAKYYGAFVPEAGFINGAPAVMLKRPDGGVESAILLRILEREGNAAIHSISVMRNPDKLGALARRVTLT